MLASKPASKSLGMWASGSSSLVFLLLTLGKWWGVEVPFLEEIFTDPTSMGGLPEFGLSASILSLWGRLKASMGIKGLF